MVPPSPKIWFPPPCNQTAKVGLISIEFDWWLTFHWARYWKFTVNFDWCWIMVGNRTCSIGLNWFRYFDWKFSFDFVSLTLPIGIMLWRFMWLQVQKILWKFQIRWFFLNNYCWEVYFLQISQIRFLWKLFETKYWNLYLKSYGMSHFPQIIYIIISRHLNLHVGQGWSIISKIEQ